MTTRDNHNSAPAQDERSPWVTVALLVAIAALAVFPMFFNFGDSDAEEPFSGTDASAGALVEEQNPEYTPWFEPLIGELPGEVESGIFALQAGIGGGILGYALGFLRGKNRSPRPETPTGTGTNQ